MTTSRLFIAFSSAAAVTAVAWTGAIDARAFQTKPATEAMPADGAKVASAGIYTAAQAERGLTVYDGSCASCHELGKFKGEEFAKVWVDKPLTELHVALTSMPMDSPGSLKPQEYADIIAYFLSINDYPAGKTELAGDEATIKSIKLDAKKP